MARKILILAGAISGTVMHSCNILYMLCCLASIYVGATALIVMSVLGASLSIVGLILNILTIKTWKKSEEEFNKKKPIIITAAVFDFVVVGVIVVYGIMIFSYLNLVYCVSSTIELLAAGIILLVGKSLKCGVKYESNSVEVCKKDNSNMEEKLKKLKEMFDKGIITDEEWKKLKSSYIKEILG